MNNNPKIVFVKPGEVNLENSLKPSPKNGEVLIKTRCTLISTGTELTILSGEFPKTSVWSSYAKFPFTPGYDNVGEVVNVGTDVDKSWIGKIVANYGRHTLYVVANTQSVHLINRNIPDEQAVFFTIAEIVMNSVRRANVKFGESVVVYGLGLLGQFTVRFCRLCGAKPVFAVDVVDSRLKRLPKDVSIIPLNPRRDNIVSIVEENTNNRKADVVFEVTGNQDLIPEEFKVLKNQGRFIILSSPRGKTLFDFHDLCNSPSFTIIGTHNSSHPQYETTDNPWTRHRNIELFFDLIADNELDVDLLISHREPYIKACELYNSLLNDRSDAMGIILEWSKK